MNKSKEFNPLTSDWKDVVEYFDNEDSVYLTTKERKDRIIRSALEEDVKKKLLSFKTKINRNTPKHKCEILVSWLEVTVVDTVLKREGYSKRKNRLLRNSVNLEEEDGVRGVIAFGSKVAKSSLMGRDPFGDTKELPKECYTLEKREDRTDVDDEVTVNIPRAEETSETRGEESARAAGATEEVRSKPAAKTYTTDGLLLKRLQEECRDLISVAIYFVLDQELETRLQIREAEYQKSATLKANSPRGQMPWSEYRSIIFNSLTEGSGWKELRVLCDMERKDGSLFMRWLAKINKSKDIVEKFGHTLSDRAYIHKAMAFLMYVEEQKIEGAFEKKYLVANADYNKANLQHDMLNEDWENFERTAGSALTNSKTKYYQRKRNRKRPLKPENRKQSGKGEGTPQRKKSRKAKPPKSEKPQRYAKTVRNPCELCLGAKLFVQAKTHVTKDCNEELRKRAAAKREVRIRKRSGEQERSYSKGKSYKAKQRPSHGRTDRCVHCTKAGRKHNRHSSSECLYETIWKGKQGAELTRLQKEFYQKARNTNITKIAKVVANMGEASEDTSSSEAESWNEDEHIPVCYASKEVYPATLSEAYPDEAEPIESESESEEEMRLAQREESSTGGSSEETELEARSPVMGDWQEMHNPCASPETEVGDTARLLSPPSYKENRQEVNASSAAAYDPRLSQNDPVPTASKVREGEEGEGWPSLSEESEGEEIRRAFRAVENGWPTEAQKRMVHDNANDYLRHATEPRHDFHRTYLHRPVQLGKDGLPVDANSSRGKQRYQSSAASADHTAEPAPDERTVYWVDGEQGMCRIVGPGGYLTYGQLARAVALTLGVEKQNLTLRYELRDICYGATKEGRDTVALTETRLRYDVKPSVAKQITPKKRKRTKYAMEASAAASAVYAAMSEEETTTSE